MLQISYKPIPTAQLQNFFRYLYYAKNDPNQITFRWTIWTILFSFAFPLYKVKMKNIEIIQFVPFSSWPFEGQGELHSLYNERREGRNKIHTMESRHHVRSNSVTFGNVRFWHALDVLDYCLCKRQSTLLVSCPSKIGTIREYWSVLCLLSDKIVELFDSRQPLQQLKMSSKNGGKDQGIILTRFLRG